MKLINTEALKELIDNMAIETIKIEEPLSQPLDMSTLGDGRVHQHRRSGEVEIVITGRVNKPDKEL